MSEDKALAQALEELSSRIFSDFPLTSSVVEFIGKPSFEVDENGLETKTQLVSFGIGAVTLEQPKVNHQFSIQATVKQTKSPDGEIGYSIESHPLGAFRVVCDPRSIKESARKEVEMTEENPLIRDVYLTGTKSNVDVSRKSQRTDDLGRVITLQPMVSEGHFTYLKTGAVHDFTIEFLSKQIKTPDGEVSHSIISQEDRPFTIKCRGWDKARGSFLSEDELNQLTKNLEKQLSNEPIRVVQFQRDDASGLWINKEESKVTIEDLSQSVLKTVREDFAKSQKREFNETIASSGIHWGLSGESDKSEALREELEELEAEDTLTEILQARCGKNLADEILQKSENKAMNEDYDMTQTHNHSRTR